MCTSPIPCPGIGGNLTRSTRDDSSPLNTIVATTYNIAVTYKADKTKDISLLWMIASGDVFTLPERIYPDYDKRAANL